MDVALSPAPPAPSSAETVTGSTRRREVAALAIVATYYLAIVSVRALTPSEMRYVEAGREMAASGDYVVPSLSFVPYFEKPIFVYWAQALAQRLFGLSPLATRLPSIAATLVCVLVTYGIGRTVRNHRFGLGAAALFLACAPFVAMGTIVTSDPPFAAWLAAAWYAYVRHDAAPTGPWIWAFWTAVGLAVLTKGPLGLVLAGAGVGLHLLLSGRLREVPRLRLLAGLAIVVAVNLPWSVLVWIRDPRFLEFFYVRQNLKAFVSGEINHEGGPWYYLLWLPAFMIPFTTIAVVALAAAVGDAFRPLAAKLRGRDAPPDAHGRLMLGCLLAGPLLVLSASGSKLGTYVMPLFPICAVLFAGWIADRLARPTRWMRWAVLLELAVVVLALALLPWVLKRRPALKEGFQAVEGFVVTAVVCFVSGLALGGGLIARRRVVPGLAILGVAAGACLLVLAPASNAFEEDRDAETLVGDLVRVRHRGEPVVLSGAIAQDYSVSFGLKERTLLWGNARELGMGHFAEVTGTDRPIPQSPYDVNGNEVKSPWLLSDAGLRDLWRGETRVWFIGRPKDVEKLLALRLGVFPLVENASRRIVSNRAVDGSPGAPSEDGR